MIPAPGAHEQSPAADTLRGCSSSCAGQCRTGASTISTSQSCRFHRHEGRGAGGEWEGDGTKARDQRDLVRPPGT